MSHRPTSRDAGDAHTMTDEPASSVEPRRSGTVSPTAARGFHSMEETIRLVCPECDAIHRVKQITLGKLYRCKKCKAGLITMSPAMLVCPSCDARTPPAHVEVSRLITCDRCAESPLMQVEFQQAPRPVREVRTVAERAAEDVHADLVAEDVSQHNVNAVTGEDEEDLQQIALALAEEDGGIDDGLGADAEGDEGGELPDVVAAAVEEATAQTGTDPLAVPETESGAARPRDAASRHGASSSPDAAFAGTPKEKTAGTYPTHHPDIDSPGRADPLRDPASTEAGTQPRSHANPGGATAPLQVPALAGAGQNDRAVAALKGVLDDLQKPLLAEIERARWSISLWIPLLAMLPLAALIGWLFSELGEASARNDRLIGLQESQYKEQELMTNDFEKLYRELQLLRRENESLRQEIEALNRRNARTP